MVDTMHMIAQASQNENSEGLSGLHGDQNGHELNAVQWYSYPWEVVYRAVNEKDRETIAAFMEKAVANGFIGYDTNRTKRDLLYNALIANNYKVDEVNTSCLCDCSALAFCAIYAATGIAFSHADEDVINCPRTKHYEEYIETMCAGKFEKLTAEEYLTSGANLIRGDILVSVSTSSDHVAVWI